MISAYSRHRLHFRTKPGCGCASASEIKRHFNFGRAMRASLNRQRARLYPKTGTGTQVLRTFALRMGFAFPGRAAGVGDGLDCLGVCGNHERAPAPARSKNAAIPDYVEPGRGHEGGKFFHQFEGLEDDVGGWVASAPS
jgi:hypothetical protein